MKVIIKEFMHSRGRAFILQLSILALVVISFGIYLGYNEVILGVIEGYLLGFIYIYVLLYRINRLSPNNLQRGKLEMWFGLIMRLGALVIIAKVAFAKSILLGYITIAMFSCSFILFLGNLIYYNYKDVQ